MIQPAAMSENKTGFLWDYKCIIMILFVKIQSLAERLAIKDAPSKYQPSK